MTRIAGIAVILMAAVCCLHADNLNEINEGITTDLMRELLLEKSFKTGLNGRGISGFFLTSSAESIFEKGFFLGGELSNIDAKISGDITRITGISAIGAYGLKHELPGPFDDLEISGKIPVLYKDDPSDSVLGLGDMLVSVKTGILEEDPFKPTVPAISIIATLMLPTGDDDLEYVDSFGLEGGVILGKTLSDADEEAEFRVNLELLADYISYNDTSDMFFKMNLGMGFPIEGVQDMYLMIELGLVSNSDAHQEDGTVVCAGIRYRKEKYNASLCFMTRSYDDQDRRDNIILASYVRKF